MSLQGNAANRLSGLELENGWMIGEKLATGREGGGSGGFFSVSYAAKRGGQQAFLKAFDIFKAIESAVARGEQLTSELFRQTQAYEFETRLHKACLNMKRIVKILDHGQVMAPPLEGDGFSNIPVPYMIMELADGGDIRRYMKKASAVDIALKLYYLRDVASGLQQLHSAKIAHQDLKPSNVMIFDNSTAKIGDLGRASQQDIASIYDGLNIAGDMGYAPPEQIYGYNLTEWVDRRQRCDLFQFGSLIAFLFFGKSINTAVRVKLNEEILPERWGGQCNSYTQALPFLIQAFNEVLIEWKQQLPGWLGEPLTSLLNQTGTPDYQQRNSYKTLKQTIPTLGIDRFVSTLNTLATKASIEARRAGAASEKTNG